VDNTDDYFRSRKYYGRVYEGSKYPQQCGFAPEIRANRICYRAQWRRQIDTFKNHFWNPETGKRKNSPAGRDRVAKRGISYVPQVNNVFPSLTIQENLDMGAFIRSDDYSQRLDQIYQLFPILGERKKQKAGQLSGGQRQMVAMGRALMVDPQVLLLDEPSAGLAPNLVEMIFEKIMDINKTGVSMIIVEQNAREALKMADHSYVLAMGRNVLDDSGEALLNNEEVGRLYLGG
jgi:ABC-type branched-subunit amino acid transport system ATPase component